LLSGRILGDTPDLPTQSIGGHRGISLSRQAAAFVARARSLPHRVISDADHAVVPNRRFRQFPANLRLRCSRSAAISVFAYVLVDGGPKVRILLPPARSALRT